MKLFQAARSFWQQTHTLKMLTGWPCVRMMPPATGRLSPGSSNAVARRYGKKFPPSLQTEQLYQALMH